MELMVADASNKVRLALSEGSCASHVGGEICRWFHV